MIVLASSSPRRRDLLLEAGIEHIVKEPSAPEAAEGDPAQIVVENARRKAVSVEGRPGDLIIGCDTLVLCSRSILGKPVDKKDAKRMVLLQISSPAQVFSGICLYEAGKKKELYGYEVSTVVLEGDVEKVDEYLDTGMWTGKAGAFGIQDRGPINARLISGEEDNVMGLPMTLLRRLLALAECEYPADAPSVVGR
ncbi:MAG: Maf family protein [Candidatus Thermoplasmatota archaeon]|nr:Maf family protein [Candidatus Thermoplasmatota archaeon]